MIAVKKIDFSPIKKRQQNPLEIFKLVKNTTKVYLRNIYAINANKNLKLSPMGNSKPRLNFDCQKNWSTNA